MKVRFALAILVTIYSQVFLFGNFHQACIVSDGQVIMGMTIIPMGILSLFLTASSIGAVSVAETPEDRHIQIASLCLSSSLLVGMVLKTVC